MRHAERRRAYDGGEERLPLGITAYRKVSRDPLTGVLNPLAFLAVLDYTMKRASRAGRETSLLFVHLHEPTRELVGDERLFQLVVRFLRHSIRGEDAIGRVGNAFLVLASDADAAGAEAVDARLAEGLWHNLGLAIAGRWSVEITVGLPGESGREIMSRATGSEPGLIEAVLPREHRSVLRFLQRG